MSKFETNFVSKYMLELSQFCMSHVKIDARAEIITIAS